MTDYKQLCVELVAIEDALMGGAALSSNQGQALDGYSALASFRSLANRARAALAEPEPDDREPGSVGGQLSDQGLLDLAAKAIDGYTSCGIAVGEYEPATEQVVEAYGSELIDFARAALAAALVEPETEGPTDEKIMELMPQPMRDDLAAAARALARFEPDNIKAASVFRIILNRHVVDHARAVLARWGNRQELLDSSPAD